HERDTGCLRRGGRASRPGVPGVGARPRVPRPRVRQREGRAGGPPARDARPRPLRSRPSRDVGRGPGRGGPSASVRPDHRLHVRGRGSARPREGAGLGRAREAVLARRPARRRGGMPVAARAAHADGVRGYGFTREPWLEEGAMKTAVAAVLGSSLALAGGGALAAQAADGAATEKTPVLTGRWKLDPEKSDDARTKMQDVMGEGRQGRGDDGGGSGSGGQGGRGHWGGGGGGGHWGGHGGGYGGSGYHGGG